MIQENAYHVATYQDLKTQGFRITQREQLDVALKLLEIIGMFDPNIDHVHERDLDGRTGKYRPTKKVDLIPGSQMSGLGALRLYGVGGESRRQLSYSVITQQEKYTPRVPGPVADAAMERRPKAEITQARGKVRSTHDPIEDGRRVYEILQTRRSLSERDFSLTLIEETGFVRITLPHEMLRERIETWGQYIIGLEFQPVVYKDRGDQPQRGTGRTGVDQSEDMHGNIPFLCLPLD